MVGSAAVFGSAFAFLAMSGNDKHASHAVHEGTTHMKEYHATGESAKSHEDAVATPSALGSGAHPASEGGESGSSSNSSDDSSDASPAEQQSIAQSLKTDAPAQAQHAEADESKETVQPVESSGSEDSSAPAADDDEGRKAEDIPQSEIDAAVTKEAQTDAPKTAYAAEIEESHKKGEASQ